MSTEVKGCIISCFPVANAEDFLASRGQARGIFTGGYGLPGAFLIATPTGIVVRFCSGNSLPHKVAKNGPLTTA